MPKYRKFYTKTVESLDINDMPDDFTRLLWVMLPLGLCAEGRGVDNPSWVKAKIFPLRLDVTFEMIEDALTWFSERGMICRYEVGGRCFFCILSWHRYQGNTERESETNYPPPPDESVPDSRQTPDKLPTDSRSQGDAHAQGEGDVPAQEQRSPHPPAPDGPYPVLEAYVEETGLKFPKGRAGKTMCAELVEAIGAAPEAVQTVRTILRGGIRLGWNPRNISWVIDHFKDGRVPGERRDNGRNATGPPAQATGPPIVITGLDETPEWLRG